MAAEQVFLQREHLVLGDALVGELAEAGVDAVNRFAARELIEQHFARADHAIARGRGELQRVDPTVEQVLGIGERQAVAGERQRLAPCFSRHAGIIETTI